MKNLIEIYKKMDVKFRRKFVALMVFIFIFIILTIALVTVDQQKAEKRQIERFQQEMMARLLAEQASRQEEAAKEYTEEDFQKAKENMPPVKEVDLDEK